MNKLKIGDKAYNTFNDYFVPELFNKYLKVGTVIEVDYLKDMSTISYEDGTVVIFINEYLRLLKKCPDYLRVT